MSSSICAPRTSAREKFHFYNTLSILLKAVEGQKTTIDLRNESTITGLIDHADGFMNVVMKDCVFIDPRGDTFQYDMFFVQARNIRLVHIPPHIPIIPAIKDQLKKVSGHLSEVKSTKLTNRETRAWKSQRQGLAAVEKILEEKKNKIVESTPSESN